MYIHSPILPVKCFAFFFLFLQNFSFYFLLLHKISFFFIFQQYQEKTAGISFSLYKYIHTRTDKAGMIMKKEINNLYNDLVNKNKYSLLRIFLETNKDDILKAVTNKVSYKNIYNTFKEISDIDISYRRFCQILSEFKIKYIYNQELKDITPKEKIETSDIEQPKILAVEISEYEQTAQTKEQEKEEFKKYVPADETPSNKTNSEEPKKLSRKERLLAIKNSEDKIIDVQKDQEKFIWTPSIKK